MVLESLDRLSNWHAKRLDDKQTSEYVKALQGIPAEAMADITNQHIEETTPFPSRFPSPTALKAKWHQWQSAHPQKMTKRTEFKPVDCPDCGSRLGIIEGRICREGVFYNEIALCGSCQNWLAHTPNTTELPIATRQQMVLKGYEIIYPPKSPFRKHSKPVRQMVGGVGHHTNPGKRKEYFDKRKRQGPPPLPEL